VGGPAGRDPRRPCRGRALVFLSLALVSPLPVFVGVGAVASQVAPTRRMATGLAGAVLAVALLLRMVADTSSAGWLRWATPLGWAEEVRPFAGARPAVLVLPALAALALLLVAARLERRRDIGQGLLAAHDSAPPRLRLLASPTTLALRTQRGGLLAWLIGVGVFALIMGVISDSVVSGLSQSVQDLLQKLGTAATTPSGYLGFAFQYLLLALSLFACFQLAAMREDETEQRLETLFALPVSRALVRRAAGARGRRRRGARAGGRGAGLGGRGLPGSRRRLRPHDRGRGQLPARRRPLPGPRRPRPRARPAAGTTIAYALVGAAFLWETIGGLIEAPGWALDLSPFHHVGLVPAQSFQAGGAAALLAVGALAGLAGALCFARRDLTS
jgi:ABC-2 type transport system permease protein